MTNTEVNAGEIEYVPAGYTTKVSGYFMTEQAGRDVLEGWTTDRAAKETYKAALDDMRYEWQSFKVSMDEQITTIRNELAEERATFKAELRKAKRPGLGVAIGVTYTTDGDVRFGITLGYVYKIF